MTEQETTQEQKNNPAAPVTWKDLVRQHTTGPVFSLAVHILILVVLGTLVVIVPSSTTDDAETVQLTEQEPVVPPPEEEPIPSDMTVLDSSSPSLDRYESNNQQMEDVGVTDLEIMTDIDISSPLVIPDSLSALKLQGVLPFGRPGGGKMGDGRDGDGRGNLEGMLQGVFYDLKQTRGRRPTEAMGNPNLENDHTRDRILPVLKEFINGPWRREYDKDGRVHYPALDEYYCSPTRLWNSCFYTSQIKATEAPAAYQCGKDVSTGGWTCIYSGNVVAPFSGKFRFVGFGDDILLVRFDRNIVFDYGWYSCTLASNMWFFGEHRDSYKEVLSGRKPPENERQRRQIADSAIYSKHKLDLYVPQFNGNHGIAKGTVLEVEQGQVYPIEILISEVPGEWFSLLLFIEQLDENGKPLEKDPESFTLFRTTLALPHQNTPAEDRRFFMPKFKPYGPIWRVVSSTDSDGGAAVKSGKLPQSVLNKRNEARTSAVSEDDDDLIL